MTASSTTDSTDTFVAAYEDLRTHVLTGSAAGRGSGLVLLLRQGMAAWMTRRPARSVPGELAAVPGPRTTAPLLSDELHAGLVRALASMALACGRNA